jgi:hypothetical protein
MMNGQKFIGENDDWPKEWYWAHLPGVRGPKADAIWVDEVKSIEEIEDAEFLRHIDHAKEELLKIEERWKEMPTQAQVIRRLKDPEIVREGDELVMKFDLNFLKYTVHRLEEGRPLCGFSDKLPQEWPPGHVWIYVSSPQTVPAKYRKHNVVFCQECDAALRKRRLRQRDQ